MAWHNSLGTYWFQHLGKLLGSVSIIQPGTSKKAPEVQMRLLAFRGLGFVGGGGYLQEIVVVMLMLSLSLSRVICVTWLY